MNTYKIKAASVGALAALLESAQAGKAQQLVSYDGGVLTFRGDVVKYPEPEYIEGEPYQLMEGQTYTVNPETGEQTLDEGSGTPVMQDEIQYGDPVTTTDPDTGEEVTYRPQTIVQVPVMITPREPTGSWLCEVALPEPDEDLAAIAI